MSQHIEFSMMNEIGMEEFETKIAYFFGVANPQLVIEAYIKALEKLEEVGAKSPLLLLEQEVGFYLEKAYKEIARQRNWNFDTHKAGHLELQIILGNANGEGFEEVKDLMTQLYTLIFQSSSENIEKAAMLRTFLYQYKVALLKREQKISQEEMKMLIAISDTSKKLLSAIK